MHDTRISSTGWQYASGTTIAQFPANGYLYQTALAEHRTNHKQPHAIYGLFQPSKSSGRIAIYGDSNCLDSNHRQDVMCTSLLRQILSYTCDAIIPVSVFPPESILATPYSEPTGSELPSRPKTNNLAKYSRVISLNAQPQCDLHSAQGNSNNIMSSWFSASKPSTNTAINLRDSIISSTIDTRQATNSPLSTLIIILLVIVGCIIFCAKYAPTTFRRYFTTERDRTSPQFIPTSHMTPPSSLSRFRSPPNNSSNNLYMNRETFERVERMEQSQPVYFA
jgi:hypothetical protein